MTERLHNFTLHRSLASLLACASFGVLLPPGAAAQGGSSLFAVGEGASRAPARSVPAPAASAPPSASPAAGRAVQKSPAPRSAASRSKPARPTAQRQPRGRNVASRPAGAVALSGRWQDSECIPLTGVTHRPALYVKRQYDFDDARRAWRLDAAVYTSDRCIVDSRLLTYEGQGTFTVTGKSRVASNAYDASFKIDRWAATPVSRQGVLTLLNGRCGSGHFEENHALDLSTSGCTTLGIRSIRQSPTEVELVSVSNGKFFLGSRAFVPGLSDARPAQLSSYGLTRVR